MFDTTIVAWKTRLRQRQAAANPGQLPDAGAEQGRDLHTLYQNRDLLPDWVSASSKAIHCLEQLGPLAWHDFPERSLENPSPLPVVPYAAVAAAYLIKLEQGLVSVGHLPDYPVDHAAAISMSSSARQMSRLPSDSAPFHRFLPGCRLPFGKRDRTSPKT